MKRRFLVFLVVILSIGNILVSNAASSANDVNVSLTSADRYGTKGVRVGFVMQNAGAEDVLVVFQTPTAKFGGMSELDAAAINCGIKGYTVLPSYSACSQRVPAGTKVKGYFYFTGIPDNVKTLERLAFRAVYYPNYVVPDFDGPVVVKNISGISINDYKTSNTSGCYVQNPDVTLKFNSLQRSGSTVKLKFTLTNGTGINTFSFNDWKAYDESGVEYQPQGLSLNMTMENYRDQIYSEATTLIKMAPFSSTTFTLEISNVPQGVQSFSMIRIPIYECSSTISGSLLGNSDADKFAKSHIILRNLTITKAPVSTTKTTNSRPVKRTTRR